MSTLDRAVNNDLLMISKSLLPYIRTERQKSIAILIKAVELIYTINLFSNEDFVHSMNRSGESGWEKHFLKDVKQNLSSDRAYFIDAILKIAEAKDLLSLRDAQTNNEEQPRYTLHSQDSGIPVNAIEDPPAMSHPAPAPKTNSGAANPDQIIDKLSPLLEPSQVQLLKVLSSFIK